MNYANQLTIARLVAVVPVMAALYVQFPGNRTAATVLYSAAILTDYLDGILARRSGKVTAFGKLMDSIADKALIVSLFFALVAEGSMPAWMAAIMVVREFAVTGLRMVALEGGEVIAANRWGKAKMVSQSLAVFILLLGYSPPPDRTGRAPDGPPQKAIADGGPNHPRRGRDGPEARRRA